MIGMVLYYSVITVCPLDVVTPTFNDVGDATSLFFFILVYLDADIIT